jgi:hypothetical protein
MLHDFAHAVARGAGWHAGRELWHVVKDGAFVLFVAVFVATWPGWRRR